MENFKNFIVINHSPELTKNKKDQVLLVLRNDYELWNLPGGGLENNETPWQGVIREVKEETGFDVEVINLLGVYSKPDKNEISFSFECKIISGKLTLNDEAKEIKYFSLANIPPNTSPKQVARIKDFFENKNNKPILKTQSGLSSIELIKQGKL